MSEFVEWGALGNVVFVGILVGAGVPFMFALGVWAIAGENARNADGHLPVGRRVVSWIAFGVAVLASLAGIAMLVVGGHQLEEMLPSWLN